MKKFSENIRLLKESVIKGPASLCDEYEKKSLDLDEEYNDKFLKMIYLILNNYMEYDEDPLIDNDGDYILNLEDSIDLSSSETVNTIIHQEDGVWTVDGENFDNSQDDHFNSGIGNLDTQQQSNLLKGMMEIEGILKNYGTKAIIKINQ